MLRTWKAFVVSVILAIGLPILVVNHFSSTRQKETTSQSACASAGRGETCVGECYIVDYKNGVYYFACRKEQFGSALSQFIASRPGDELVSMVEDGTEAAGVTRGYFVVFRRKVQ